MEKSTSRKSAYKDAVKSAENMGFDLPNREEAKARMEASAEHRIKVMKAGRDASMARPDGDTWLNGRVAG